MSVNLGNGTSGTATGVTGAVTGITAVIGSSHNDTLSAGSVPGVALTGGLGANTLSGTGAGDSVVESISSSYTLTSTKLTGSSPSFTDSLSGITVVSLSAVSLTSDAFTVSGWTGTGMLSSPAGSTATIVDAAAGSFSLANAQLTAANTTLTLSGITTANLTDTSTSGGNTFTITGWTGSGTLRGKSETLVDSIDASVNLANTSLAVAGLPTLSLSGFTTVNLSDTAGGDTFTVSGWTGAGMLTDSGTEADAVTASKSASYTLTDSSLSSTDHMSLGLSGITSASLTATSAGRTFTVTGWTGGGSLVDTATTGDAVTDAANGSFTLTNSQLTAPNTALDLSNITTANLTDMGAGGNTFAITGWTGKGTLKGKSEALIDTVAASVTLTNTSLAVTALPALTLNGFTTANVTDTAGGNTFTVSGWTGSGSLTDSAGSGDTVAASKNASYTLANSLLTSTDKMSLALNGITTANLAATTGGRTFTVSGWTGTGSLTDTGSGIVTATKSAGFTLSNMSLTSTDGIALSLAGMTTANLTTTAAGGSPSYIVDASAFTGVTNLSAGGVVNAFLFGGSGIGSTLSATGTGNDVLIGGSGKTTLTDSGTGSNILIGGPGVDTLTGNGNDILITGTTSYDSDRSANIAALDAILAEWSSSDSYSLRISKIMSGLGAGGTDALNASTCLSDGVANSVSDGPASTQNNWFIVNSKDKVTKQSDEQELVV